MELLGCLVIALVVFGVSLNFRILNPRFMDWCLTWDSDLANYYQAFAFFRRSEWSFPVVTLTSNLQYPVGSNITLLDALPLVSVPLKLIDALLPVRFQFFGVWLLLCHFLQAFFGFELLRTLGVTRLLAFCGAALVCAATPLVIRHGHTQLCAHWLILASMLAVCRSTPSKSLVWLPSLALWIHAYFMPMCLAFALVGQLKFARTRNALWRAAATLGGLLLSFWLLGFFDMRRTQNGGYEYFVADLSTFFNPMGMKTLLPLAPPRPTTPGEWEGTAYLGCAGFLLALLWLGALLLPRFRRKVSAWALLLVCLGFALYAFTATPQLYGEKLARFATLSEWLAPLGTRFRATGRFIWPLHYYILVFGLKALQEFSALLPRLQLVGPVLVLLQAADLGPHYWLLGQNPALTATVDLSVPADVQAQLKSDTRFMFFWPPPNTPCGRARWHGPYYNLTLFAAEHGLITNADVGNARASGEDRKTVCRFTQRLRQRSELYPDVIFVMR